LSSVDKATKRRLVICLTGMPGAGKSVVAEASLGFGFQIFRMGDDVRLEAGRRNLEPTDQNLGSIMLELRQKNGAVAIAALCSARIQQEGASNLITIDGIRSIAELHEFRKLGKTLLVAVHASPEKRYEFLQARARQDSPASVQSFGLRDERELSVGVGEVMAIADEVISNTGSLEDLRQSAARLFAKSKQDFQATSH
jgi:dephospho-CoA kinase